MIAFSEFDSARGVIPAIAGVVPLASFDSMTLMPPGCLVPVKPITHPEFPGRGTNCGIAVINICGNTVST